MPVYLKLHEKDSSALYVVGGAKDPRHKGWIEGVSFAFGDREQAPMNVHGGSGVGAKTVKINSVYLTREQDVATTALFALVARPPTVQLEAQVDIVDGSATKNPPTVTYKLREVVVSHISYSGSAGEAKPLESVELSLSGIEVDYGGVTK